MKICLWQFVTAQNSSIVKLFMCSSSIRWFIELGQKKNARKVMSCEICNSFNFFQIACFQKIDQISLCFSLAFL